MTTAEYQVTDFTTDTASELKAKIDGNSEVAKRIAAAYQAYAAATPDMTVKVAAGAIMVNGGLVTNAIQTSGTITAPVSNPRIDRVVIDQLTGVASIITGAENASPTAPAITAGKVPIAQIALATSTTAITNSLITDERAALVTLNINALDEDTSPDLTADFLLEWDTSAGVMKKVKPTNIADGTDSVARDQIALTNIRLMLNSNVATGALYQGKQWDLATDEWGSTSTNESYTAPGSFGYYSNPSSYAANFISGGTVSASSEIGGYEATKAVDGNTGSFWLANSAVPIWLKYDLGGGIAKTARKLRIYPADNGGTVRARAWDLEGSNDDTNWTAITSGELANSVAWQEFTFDNATSYRYYRLNITSAYEAWPTAPGLAEFELLEAVAPQNMTLIPDAAVSVSAAPTYMDGYFLYKDDSTTAVLGTDLTVELSRDNGTTYTTATLTTLASYDGTYSVIKARADVSAQPSGTSMLCRIKTLNNKAQRVAAPALYAE